MGGCTAAGTCTGKGRIIAYVYAAMPMLLTFLCLVINNIIIYVHVRKSLHQPPQPADPMNSSADSATTQKTANDAETSGVFREKTAPNKSRREALRKTRETRLTREAAIQGFLYVAGYLISYVPAMAVQFLDSYGYGIEDQAALYPLLVVNSLFVPLQGCFNAFIYIRPTYIRFRAAHPEMPARWVLRKALFDPKIPRLESTQNNEPSGPSGRSART